MQSDACARKLCAATPLATLKLGPTANAVFAAQVGFWAWHKHGTDDRSRAARSFVVSMRKVLTLLARCCVGREEEGVFVQAAGLLRQLEKVRACI